MHYVFISAIFSDEYKSRSAEGKPLYLDAQATTPIVNRSDKL